MAKTIFYYFANLIENCFVICSGCKLFCCFLTATKVPRDATWRKTTDSKVQKKFIGGDKDYKGSDCQIYCYKDKTTGDLRNWDDSAQCKGVEVSIDRGHMIAAAYGLGHSLKHGVTETFTYTNVVPQISSFNRGAWSKGEEGMIEFAQKCEDEAHKNSLHANIFVVVGMIPASFLGKPRYILYLISSFNRETKSRYANISVFITMKTINFYFLLPW